MLTYTYVTILQWINGHILEDFVPVTQPISGFLFGIWRQIESNNGSKNTFDVYATKQ